jgi:hypothetical protein
MNNKYHPKWFLLISILPLFYIFILILIENHNQFAEYIKDPSDRFVFGLVALFIYIIIGIWHATQRWLKEKEIHLIALIAGFIVPGFIFFAFFEIDNTNHILLEYQYLGIHFTSIEFVASLFSIGVVYCLLFSIIKIQSNKLAPVGWSVVFAVVTPLFIYFLATISDIRLLRGIPEALMEFLFIAAAIFVAYHIVFILI